MAPLGWAPPEEVLGEYRVVIRPFLRWLAWGQVALWTVLVVGNLDAPWTWLSWLRLVTAALFVTSAVTLGRSGTRITAEGLRVCGGLWSSRLVPWASVAGVVVTEAPRPVVTALLTSGRRRALHGVRRDVGQRLAASLAARTADERPAMTA